MKPCHHGLLVALFGLVLGRCAPAVNKEPVVSPTERGVSVEPRASASSPESEPAPPGTQTPAEVESKLSTRCNEGMAFACYALAVAKGPSSASELELFNRACELDREGGVCFLIATEQYLAEDLSSFKDDTAQHRRDAARFARAACDKSGELAPSGACSLADSLQALVSPADVTPLLPLTVAGLRFGSSWGEATEACDALLGERGEEGLVPCASPPMDPFNAVKLVMLRFCQERVCEISLWFREKGRDHVVERVMAKLQQRYGEGGARVPAASCASSLGSEKQWRKTWLSRPYRGREMLMLNANHECGPEESSPSLTLWYRNAAGVQRRVREFRDLQRNF